MTGRLKDWRRGARSVRDRLSLEGRRKGSMDVVESGPPANEKAEEEV